MTQQGKASIRKCSTDDVPVLVRIIRDSFRDVADQFGLTPENCPTHPSNCTAEWVEADLNNGVLYFLLSEDGIPCGCVGAERLSSDAFCMQRLSVLPEKRKQSYGRILVQTVLDLTRESGLTEVDIGLIADHSELREWYAGLGFVPVQAVHYEFLPFDVLYMKLKL